MAEPKIHFNKLLQKSTVSSNTDTKCFIYLQSKWLLEDGVEFVIQDTKGQKCYKGKLTIDAMKDSANELEIPFTEFYEEVSEALTTKDLALPGFEYEVDAAEMLFKLIKKQDFNIHITYLEVPLRELNQNYEMLDTALDLLSGQQKSGVKQVQQTARNNQDFEELQAALKKCLEDKNKLEKKMLKKFALLLNSKKEKISELEEKLQQQEEAINGNESAGSEADGEEHIEEVEADVRMDAETISTGNTRKPLATCKRNKRQPLPEHADEDDVADFEAATQPMIELDTSAIGVMPKRTRRICDDDE